MVEHDVGLGNEARGFDLPEVLHVGVVELEIAVFIHPSEGEVCGSMS